MKQPKKLTRNQKGELRDRFGMDPKDFACLYDVGYEALYINKNTGEKVLINRSPEGGKRICAEGEVE